MKRTYLAALLPMAATALIALAAPSDAAAQRSAWSGSGNFSVVSDYRFRGVSQTYNLPAVQGGFDLGHSAGFYFGTWGSSVGTNVVAHVGYQSVKNFSRLKNTDWKLGATTEALNLTWGLAYIGSNAKDAAYTVLNASDGAAKVVAKDTVILSVGKTF